MKKYLLISFIAMMLPNCARPTNPVGSTVNAFKTVDGRRLFIIQAKDPTLFCTFVQWEQEKPEVFKGPLSRKKLGNALRFAPYWADALAAGLGALTAGVTGNAAAGIATSGAGMLVIGNIFQDDWRAELAMVGASSGALALSHDGWKFYKSAAAPIASLSVLAGEALIRGERIKRGSRYRPDQSISLDLMEKFYKGLRRQKLDGHPIICERLLLEGEPI